MYSTMFKLKLRHVVVDMEKGKIKFTLNNEENTFVGP